MMRHSRHGRHGCEKVVAKVLQPFKGLTARYSAQCSPLSCSNSMLAFTLIFLLSLEVLVGILVLLRAPVLALLLLQACCMLVSVLFCANILIQDKPCITYSLPMCKADILLIGKQGNNEVRQGNQVRESFVKLITKF
eukprot:871048-Pelagomonas_calceolata.AAC.1